MRRYSGSSDSMVRVVARRRPILPRPIRIIGLGRVNTTSRNWADRSDPPQKIGTRRRNGELCCPPPRPLRRGKAPFLSRCRTYRWVGYPGTVSRISCVVGMLLVQDNLSAKPRGRRSRPARQEPIVAGVSLTSTGSDIAPVPPVRATAVNQQAQLDFEECESGELGNGRFGRLEIQAYRFVIGRLTSSRRRNVAVRTVRLRLHVNTWHKALVRTDHKSGQHLAH